MRAEIKEMLGNIHEVSKYVFQKSFHTMNDKHLYPGQPKILSLIKANEGITQKDLSEKNCVTPATITGTLNKLEANHYVYRVTDETDKRIMRVYLTPEGHDLADYSEKYMLALVEQLFTGFSDEELRTFSGLIKKLKNNLQDNPKHNENEP